MKTYRVLAFANYEYLYTTHGDDYFIKGFRVVGVNLTKSEAITIARALNYFKNGGDDDDIKPSIVTFLI